MQVGRKGEPLRTIRRASFPVFEFIDDDALFIIVSHIDLKKRSKFAQTCKRFWNVANDCTKKQLNLSGEQWDCFLDVMRGKNVFITGAAGCGKSHLLKVIIRCLGREGVAVTASTGCAAAVIGASTFHSTCSIGLGKAPVKVIVNKIVKENYYAFRRMNELKTLIVDEVGMLTGSVFDKAGSVIGIIRRIFGSDYQSLMRNAELTVPFDTVQLVLCGDVLQLPPVDSEKEGWIFESKCWKTLDFRTHVLKQVHRQQDVKFIQVLQRARLGMATISDLSYLVHNSAKTPMENSLKLYAVNQKADEENETRLAQINEAVHRFDAIDSGMDANVPDSRVQEILKHCLAPRQLFLKKGARVMCLKNVNITLVNGSMGTVKDFSFSRDQGENGRIIQAHVTVEFDGQLGDSNFLHTFSTHMPGCEVDPNILFTIRGQNQKKLAQRIQIPLRLAWAVSIHKSQGKCTRNIALCIENHDSHTTVCKNRRYVAVKRAH